MSKSTYEEVCMKRKVLGFVVALMAVATVGLVQLSAKAETIDNTPDCDKYSVVWCGASTEAAMRAAIVKGNDGHNTDMAAVYNSFGIVTSQITGMKAGVVYQNGNVVVDGKVVAKDAVMAARYLGGTAIAGSATAKRVSVSAMDSAQAALVKLDANGKFLFAIMTPCANPVVATPTYVPPQPAASCKAVTVDTLSRTQFRFNATATVANGAKVSSYVFTVKDASGKVVTTQTVTSASLSASTTYAQTKAGAYKVSVVVKTTAGDKTSADCEKTFTVTPPPAPSMVEVCNPATGEIITVTKAEESKYAPIDSPKCHSIEVCQVSTGKTVTIKESQLGGDYTTDYTKCTPVVTPPETPELPHTGPADVLVKLLGIASLGGASAYYIASRRS